MKNGMPIDEKKLSKILDNLGLFAFYNAMCESYLNWFLLDSETSVSTMMKNYVFYSGMYGGVENQVASERVRKSKFRYLLSRIFMPYDRLKIRYPIIIKHKILLSIFPSP